MAAPGANSSFSRMSAGRDINSGNAGIYAQTVNINQAPAAPGAEDSAIPAIRFDAKSADFNSAGGNIIAGSQNVLGNHNQVNITNHPVQQAPVPRCPTASPNFVERDPELEQMTRFFFGENIPPDLLRIFVVIGMGGCGKTQLVRKFMERVYRRLRKVFYVDATTRATLAASLAGIAKANAFGDLSAAALSWMSSLDEPFFLYIDNADDRELDLHAYFPASTYARIVITTRLREAQQNYATGPNSAILLGDLEREHATTLLRQTSCLEKNQASDEVVITLVQELYCFALAVAQAGAAIFKMQWTVVEYLDRFRQLRTSLMDGENDGVGSRALDNYHSNVDATWRLSYNQLSQPAAHLLGVCAHFHHTGITEELFADSFHGLSGRIYQNPPIPWAEEEPLAQSFLQSFVLSDAWDGHKFRRCVQEACSFSLLSYDMISHTYSVHPLIHDSLHSVAPHPSQAGFILSGALMSRWDDLLPSDSSLIAHSCRLYSTWKDCKASPHLPPLMLLKLSEALGVYDASHSFEAERMQRAALSATRTLKLAPDDWVISRANNHLVKTLRVHRRFKEAECLQSEVLDQWRSFHGEDHPETVNSLAKLAVILHEGSRYEEAEKHFTKVTEKVRTADAKYRGSLWVLTAFAVLLLHLGRFEESEKTAAEGWETCKRILGEEDANTIHALHTLGWIISQRGRYTEAEPLQRQAVEIHRRVLGAHHPHTRIVKANLDWTLSQIQSQGAVSTPDHSISNMHSLAPSTPIVSDSAWTEATPYSRHAAFITRIPQGPLGTSHTIRCPIPTIPVLLHLSRPAQRNSHPA